MNLFDRLVEQAVQSEAALGTVRAAVEKELLHHDILREMSRSGLLAGLTFIGGTCLRICYGAPRLSEDLDFNGGADFAPARLASLGPILETTLMEKYGLPISVSEPMREDGNVNTWKLRLQTQPLAKNMPSQRIHIDICALDSQQSSPVLLRNFYGVDMGTDGLIIRAQSREEILADKWIALAFRPNRIQYRDLWDILWLGRQGVGLKTALLYGKLTARQHPWEIFMTALHKRLSDLKNNPEQHSGFRKEMERFLPTSAVRETMHEPDFWTMLTTEIHEQCDNLRSPQICGSRKFVTKNRRGGDFCNDG